MRRVINGKRYDTDQASLIHQWDNGKYVSDFHYRSKDLYRTAKGAWFLHHVGGAFTDMGRPVGNNGRGGSADIEPISDADAQAFLESHGGDEIMVEYFKVEDA
jgi:hypothetical protein